MSLEDNIQGDYVVQPQKRRISRGRKALIGLMAIGAFAATQGAGTFASFTASTDNAGGTLGANNPFQTPDFELANQVLSRSDGSGPGGVCLSSDDAKDFPAASPQLANIDGDNAAYCDVLFVANNFATTATANLKLENTGASDGNLFLYAVNVKATDDVQTCKLDTTGGATEDLCGDWHLTVQEYSNGGELLGDNAPNFENNGDRSNECVLPSAGVFCTTTGTDFDSLPQLASAKDIGLLPFVNSGGGEDNSDVRYFKVTARLPKDAGCTDVAENAGAGNGFDDVSGLGCHNEKSNGSAQIQLRWVLRA